MEKRRIHPQLNYKGSYIFLRCILKPSSNPNYWRLWKVPIGFILKTLPSSMPLSVNGWIIYIRNRSRATPRMILDLLMSFESLVEVASRTCREELRDKFWLWALFYISFVCWQHIWSTQSDYRSYPKKAATRCVPRYAHPFLEPCWKIPCQG